MKVYHCPHQHIRTEAGGLSVLSMCVVQGSISSTKPNKTNKTPTKIQDIPCSPESFLDLGRDFFFFSDGIWLCCPGWHQNSRARVGAVAQQ